MTKQIPHSESSTSILYLQHPINHQNREIRLLSLLPGSFDDDLKCDINSVSLDMEGLEYETLSYTWGNGAITAPIIVGGYHFEITTNLSDAFRHLRSRSNSKPLVLWADAICIDQSNDIEKSRQVAMMSDIYRLCSRVYLWLGSGYLSSNPFTVFEFLYRDDHFSEAFVSQMTKAEITALLDSPWWSRMWTVQETVLPPSALVVYGHWSMPWDLLVRSLNSYMQHRHICCRYIWPFEMHYSISNIRNLVVSIEAIRTNALGSWDLSGLHYLTVRLRLRLATNPKDKIIGLLGLIDTSSLQRGERSYLDYTHRTSTTYLKYFSIMLENDPTGFHCFVGSGFNSPHQSDICLPSWVPNFAQAIGYGESFSELVRFGRYDCYNASAGRSRNFVVDKANLHIQGYTHDQIDSIYEINSPKSLWDFLNTLSGFESMTARNDYLRTLTGNLRLALSKDGRIRLGRAVDWEKQVITAEELALVDEFVKEQPLHENLDLDMRRDIEIIIRWQVDGRVFFLTRNNSMGLCEPGAKVGDQVCIFYGGNVPFIIRKSFADTTASPEKQAYDFIGACYLQGFMYGEVFQAPGFDLKNEEVFWFPGSHCCPEPEEEI